MKGKMSSRKIDKILSKQVRKETRTYHHQFLASTPFTGGRLKAGDKMKLSIENLGEQNSKVVAL